MKFISLFFSSTILLYSLTLTCFASTRDGLIAEYTFANQSALDSSGNGNHGIIHNTQSVGDRNNVTNSAMFMNGQDAWIEIPTSTLYNNLTSITLSLWIRPQKGPNGENRAGSLLGKQPSGWYSQTHSSSTSNHGGLFDFDLCYDNNALKLYFCSQFSGGGSEGHMANMPSLQYDQWQHIAITANQAQNRVKFYVNGTLVDDIVYSVYINIGRILSQVNTEPLRIGKRKDADFNQNLYFIGGMDDIKIYNRELSLSEVEELADFHQYSITLDPNDGSNATNIVFATYNAPMPQAPQPVRTGWAFTGYYDQPEGGSQYYTASMASARTWLSTNNITLYAQWLSCGIVRFKTPIVTISESGGFLTIPVERVNGSYGSASVTVISQDGSATEDIDFAATYSTLTWTNGNTATKNCYVPILSDDTAEGNETFTLHLINTIGASVNPTDVASVTIIDDDISVPPTIRLETGLESDLLAFGNVITNTVLGKTIQIWNDGTMPLSITNITASEGFSVTQQVFTVSAGEMAPLNVFFEPTLLGDYTGTIELMCVSALGTSIIGATGRGIDPSSSFAHRTISGKTAIIALHVPTESTVLAVEDKLPSGMFPLSISDGGIWDSTSQKVKWFFDKQNDVRDRALQYTVGTLGSVVTGSVSFGDGETHLITGDTDFTSDGTPGRLHPADANGDWSVNQSEIATSITRWKNGQEDLKTAIAIRGITLYLQGEYYVYNSTVSAEAKRWIPAREALPAKLSTPLFAEDLSLPQESVARNIQSNRVVIVVTPPAGTLAYGMEESVATGVNVSDISHDGVWDSTNRKVKWGFFDGTSRELSYWVRGTEGTQVSLAGTASFDGSEDAVSGGSLAAVPLTYQTWAVSKGLTGSGDFAALNPGRGEPNGLLYAFGSNLATNEPTIEIKWIDGMPVIETPVQDPSTTPFIHVEILGSYDLRNLTWPISLQPVENSAGTPSNRRRWKAPDNTVTNQLFFKVRVTNK